jgi:hypothetical protein
MTPTAQRIYNNLFEYLETHCTLDNNIPAETGCAEAVSFILEKSGVGGLPLTGIPGTATLYEWLSSNPHFERVYAPEAGAVIISPTGYGNNTVSGHTGFLGKYGKLYGGDYGIVSNDSNTGLLLELWDLTRWQKYYGQQGGLPVAFFRAL